MEHVGAVVPQTYRTQPCRALPPSSPPHSLYLAAPRLPHATPLRLGSAGECLRGRGSPPCRRLGAGGCQAQALALRFCRLQALLERGQPCRQRLQVLLGKEGEVDRR